MLGLGLDSDGHKRLTTGPNFVLAGGSEETHEVMTEKAIKINEKLAAKGKQLEDVSHEEFDEIAHAVGCIARSPSNRPAPTRQPLPRATGPRQPPPRVLFSAVRAHKPTVPCLTQEMTTGTVARWKEKWIWFMPVEYSPYLFIVLLLIAAVSLRWRRWDLPGFGRRSFRRANPARSRTPSTSAGWNPKATPGCSSRRSITCMRSSS